MSEQTKKCPLCAETIPAELEKCKYCGAQFSVTVTGYCDHCHKMRGADPSGRCKVCGTEVKDPQVESKFVEAPAIPPSTAAPAGRTAVSAPAAKPVMRASGQRNPMRWVVGGIFVLFVCGLIAIALVFACASLSILSNLLTPTSTPRPTPWRLSTATLRPVPIPTEQDSWVKEFAQSILDDVQSRKPNFEEDFSEMGGKLDQWSDIGSGTTFTKGALRIDVNGDWSQAGGSFNASNFVLEFDLTPRILSDTSSFGVDFRIGDKRWYYLAFDTKENRAGMGLYLDDTWVEDIAEAKPVLDKVDTPIHIDLIVRGEEFAFYIDQVPLAYAKDNRILNYEVCHFWVYSESGRAEVDFDNVKFWDLNNLNS